MSNDDDHNNRKTRVDVDVEGPVGPLYNSGTDDHNDRTQGVGEDVEKDAVHVHISTGTLCRRRLSWHTAIAPVRVLVLVVGNLLTLGAIAIATRADEGILRLMRFNDHYLVVNLRHVNVVTASAVTVPMLCVGN